MEIKDGKIQPDINFYVVKFEGTAFNGEREEIIQADNETKALETFIKGKNPERIKPTAVNLIGAVGLDNPARAVEMFPSVDEETAKKLYLDFKAHTKYLEMKRGK